MPDPGHQHEVHTQAHEGGNTAGILIAIVIFAILAFMFLYFGLPALNRVGTSNTAPQVTVPDKIDVNLNQK